MIAPWNRGKGYDTRMLARKLDECRRRGFSKVEIVPYQGNTRSIQAIVNNGGVLTGEFYEDGRWSARYTIELDSFGKDKKHRALYF